MKETFDDLEKLGAEALLGDPTRSVLESPEAFVEAALSVLLDPEMRVEFRAHMRACDEITAIGLTVDRAEELAEAVRADGVIGLSPRDLADVFASRTCYDAVGAALNELDDDVSAWLDERGDSGETDRDPWRSAWLDSILATPSAVEILRFDPSPSWIDRWPRYALAALVVLAVLAATVLWQLQQPTPSSTAAERLPTVDGPIDVAPIPVPPAPRRVDTSPEREALEALADNVVMLSDDARCLEASAELTRLRADAGSTVMADEITRLAQRVTRCLDSAPAPAEPRRSAPRRAERAPTPAAVDAAPACKLDDIDAAVERARMLLLRSPSRAASRLKDVLACGEDAYVRAQLGFAVERMGRPCEALVHYRTARPALAGSIGKRVQQSIERWELACE